MLFGEISMPSFVTWVWLFEQPVRKDSRSDTRKVKEYDEIHKWKKVVMFIVCIIF